MRFFGNVLGTLITEVLTVGLNTLIGILTARLLGPEGRGILTLAMTLPLTLAHFADLGISQSNIYLIGRRGRPAEAMMANSVVFALTSGLVVATVVWLVRDLALETVLRGLPDRTLTAILVLMPLLLLHTYWMAILRAWERFRLFNLLRLLAPVLLLVCMTPVLIAVRGDVDWATAAYLVSTVLATSAGLIVVGRQVHMKRIFDYQLARESIGYGLKSYVQNLMGHLGYRVDIYLLALLLSSRDVAFYSVAVSIAELAWYIPNSVGLVLFPKLSNEAEDRIHPLTAEACRHTFIITLLATLGLTVLGLVGVPLLYGAEYRPALSPLLALGPGIIAMSLYKVLTRNFSSRNRQQVSVVVALVGLALNIGLDLLLIPHLGTTGAALASSCAYIFMGVALLVVFRRESNLSWSQIMYPRATDLARYTEVRERLLAALSRRRAT